MGSILRDSGGLSLVLMVLLYELSFSKLNDFHFRNIQIVGSSVDILSIIRINVGMLLGCMQV